MDSPKHAWCYRQMREQGKTASRALAACRKLYKPCLRLKTEGAREMCRQDMTQMLRYGRRNQHAPRVNHPC